MAGFKKKSRQQVRDSGSQDIGTGYNFNDIMPAEGSAEVSSHYKKLEKARASQAQQTKNIQQLQGQLGLLSRIFSDGHLFAIKPRHELQFPASMKEYFNSTLFNQALATANNLPVYSEELDKDVPNPDVLQNWGRQWSAFVRDRLFDYDPVRRMFNPKVEIKELLDRTFGDNGHNKLVTQYMLSQNISRKIAEQEINRILLCAATNHLFQVYGYEEDRLKEDIGASILIACNKGVSSFDINLSEDALNSYEKTQQAYDARIAARQALESLLLSLDNIINQCKEQSGKYENGLDSKTTRKPTDNITDPKEKKFSIWNNARISFERIRANIQAELQEFDKPLPDDATPNMYSEKITDFHARCEKIVATHLKPHKKQFPDMKSPLRRIKRTLSDSFKSAMRLFGIKMKPYSSVKTMGRMHRLFKLHSTNIEKTPRNRKKENSSLAKVI